MKKATFPTLLHKKAKIMAGLTRVDLIILGISYFLMSAIHISGIFQVISMALLLFILKYMQKIINPGFFRFLWPKRQISWAYKIGDDK